MMSMVWAAALQVDSFEIFVFEHNEFSLLVFIAFHDVFPRDFFAIGLSHPLVIDRTLVRFSQEFKGQLVPSCGCDKVQQGW